MSLASQVSALATRAGAELRNLRGILDGQVGVAGNYDVRGIKRFTQNTFFLQNAYIAGSAPQPDAVLRRDTIEALVAEHPHSADALTSGYLSAARLPAVLTPLRAGSASGSLTLDAARDVGGTILNITVTGNLTLNAPVNGIDGQVLRFRHTASGGQRRVSFASAIAVTTGLSASYDVPSGQTLVCALERVESRSAWLLTAATIG